ncbi:sulfatase-like hydrolase/transferase [Mucisphaera calidilacus]|uniref:Arylsulfatase n=1 Tax=Mucisphaera calidilacus TaxID=2527982 RepID=A0A518BX51_9BACT|nr:sulfatase-like hydrolase/transferase [Mucisphaera calidilacus]QDU71551.1 Arylsulfatase [Mucisphaera calidilacus]
MLRHSARCAATALTLTLAVSGCVSHDAQTDADQRPNILLILTDDQGYGDLALHGNQHLDTPRMDALGNASVRLDNFHAAPVCSPTRASLMTGRQFLSTGVWGVHGGRDYLHLGETTIAQRLSAAGYATYMMGKWHLGKSAAYLPHQRGFDESWMITDRLYMHTDPVFNHNGTTEKPKGWTAEILTDLAIDCMSREPDKPWFIYLAHPLIHEPYFAPDELVTKYRAMGLSESLATLYAMTEHLDTEVGRVVDAVTDRQNQRETIVIFMGDNGPIGNPWNLPHLTVEEMQQRNPRGWRGTKGNLYENGARVPAFVYAPERYQPRIEQSDTDVVDIVPTILDLASLPHNDATFDGLSLVPLLEGKPDALPDQRPLFMANHDARWPSWSYLYSHLPDREALRFEDQAVAVREGRYKFVLGYGSSALYDLALDTAEQQDISDQQPDVRDRLESTLRAWWEERVAAMPASYHMPTFQIGLDNAPSTYLYACAPVTVRGGVRTASHAVHDWQQDGDAIGLSVNVLRPGAYSLRADLVAGDNPSGSLTVRIGDATTTAPISEIRWPTIGTLELPADENIMWISLDHPGVADSPVIQELRGIEITPAPR